jgi:hypothetical protein
MESAAYFRSRKQYEGCEAKTQAALAKAVATIPAKAFQTAHDQRDDPFHGFAYTAAPVIANSPAAYLAATAYAVCQPQTGTGQYLLAVLNSVPGTRGPRTSALAALMGTQPKFDDVDKKLQWPPSKGRPTGAMTGMLASYGGVVLSTTPSKGKNGAAKGKDLVALKLEKTLIKQMDCVKSHTGNHLARIDSTGNIEYESICDKTALVTHDHTWFNANVVAADGKWLTAGVVFSATYGREDANVLAVWPNKSATVPSMVLGGAVK